MSELTQYQKIITVMANGNMYNWYFPYDFMQNGLGHLFVGYEASARLSELAKENPKMIESMRDGKYFKRRINWLTYKEWIDEIPTDLQTIIKEAVRKRNGDI